MIPVLKYKQYLGSGRKHAKGSASLPLCHVFLPSSKQRDNTMYYMYIGQVQENLWQLSLSKSTLNLWKKMSILHENEMLNFEKCVLPFKDLAFYHLLNNTKLKTIWSRFYI